MDSLYELLELHRMQTTKTAPNVSSADASKLAVHLDAYAGTRKSKCVLAVGQPREYGMRAKPGLNQV